MATRKKRHDEAHFSGTAVLGERGQVVIPKEARAQMELKPGDTFVVMAHNGAVIFLPKKKMEAFIKQMTAKLHL